MDVAKEFGAGEGPWAQRLFLYLPDKDKEGDGVND